jgi:HAD superfamily hydrolase (TIGR01490 family)
MHLSKIKIALFDVDQTLLLTNSMLDFIDFFFMEYYGQQSGKIKQDKYKISQLGSDNKRENLNRLYYTHFKDIKRSALEDLGKKWFEQTLSKNKHLFNQVVLNRLTKYKQDDYRVVFVSGGFFAPLNPIVEYLEVDVLLCVKPVVNQGVLTGEIEGIQTIGEGKVTAILNHFKDEQVDWSSSFAYGDHISDLAMLKLVGHPVVVGNDNKLLQIAKEQHWEFILN